MSDPNNSGFTEPLDSSPIELEKWQGGSVQATDGECRRCWYRETGDFEYIVHYGEDFQHVRLEKWLGQSLQSVPVEAEFDGHDEENEDFLALVKAFFDLVNPNIER